MRPLHCSESICPERVNDRCPTANYANTSLAIFSSTPGLAAVTHRGGRFSPAQPSFVGERDGIFGAELLSLGHCLDPLGTVPTDVGDAPVVILDEIGHDGLAAGRYAQVSTPTPSWRPPTAKKSPLGHVANPSYLIHHAQSAWSQ
jgi:hypothetical protein